MRKMDENAERSCRCAAHQEATPTGTATIHPTNSHPNTTIQPATVPVYPANTQPVKNTSAYPTSGYPNSAYPTGTQPVPITAYPASAYPTGAQPVTASAYPTGGQPVTSSAYLTGVQPVPTSAYHTGVQPVPASAYPTGVQPVPTSAYPTGVQPATGSAYPTGTQPVTASAYPNSAYTTVTHPAAAKSATGYPATGHPTTGHPATGHPTKTQPGSAHPNSQQSPSTKGLRFTPEMIRDQEMLVSTMSQQGISEDLIRRQYERLLEEQSKQLRYIKDEPSAPATERKEPEKVAEPHNRPKQVPDAHQQPHVPPEGTYASPAHYQYALQQQAAINQQQALMQQQQALMNQQQAMMKQQQGQPPAAEEKKEKTQPGSDADETAPPPKIQPSSLLKIRLKKEALNSSKRNNGLQEAKTALKIIQESRSKIAQDRLAAEVENMLRLNGTQNRTPGEQAQSNQAEGGNRGRTTSANGLENSRNQDNPQIRRYHPHSAAATYGTHSSTHSARHSDQQHQNQAAEGMTTNNAPPAEPIPQQMYNNAHSELYEPKVIGGFTYFARRCNGPPQTGHGYPPADYANQQQIQQIQSQMDPRTAVAPSN